MNRRSFLAALGIGGLSTTATWPAHSQAKAPAITRPIEQIRTQWKGLLAPGAANVVDAPNPPQKLDNAEWRKRLTREQFHILREEGTEPPGTHPLNNEKRRGVYVCAGCGLALFTSEMKFDSGTGWPSFFTSIPSHFNTKRDFKLFLPRTEYHCARCEGHHGHLFNDGPAPTSERWCNNGAALRFVPLEKA